MPSQELEQGRVRAYLDRLICQEIDTFGAATTESVRRAWYTRRLKPPVSPNRVRGRLKALAAKRKILYLERDAYGRADGSSPTVEGMGRVWSYLYPEIISAMSTRPGSYWTVQDVLHALPVSPDANDSRVRNALYRLMRYGHVEPVEGGRLAWRLTPKPEPVARARAAKPAPVDVFA